MKPEYVHVTVVTKEALDAIKVGDSVRINEWRRPMRVVGVSANYFMMVQTNFGKLHYSVCEKKPWGGTRRNSMRGGMFHCGTDNWIGCSLGFPEDVSSQHQVSEYLDEFENGHTELSVRTSIPIHQFYVRGA